MNNKLAKENGKDDNKTKKITDFFGKIETLEDAHRISIPAAVVTALVGFYSLIYTILYFNELMFLGALDLILWSILGFGIFKNSRVALLNTFIMYVLGGAFFRMTPLWHNNIFATIYVLTLVFALRGTFAYNKLLKKNEGAK
ncbi:MAG: hypothetical protein LDL13_02765 [Calditerrivibrio sp.]|nr:hypothetical protein [Calditerrivibrio sp.]